MPGAREEVSGDPVSENLQLLERYYVAWSSGDPDAIAAFFTPDFQGHAMGQNFDLAGLLAVRAQLARSFPDQSIATLDAIADTEKVATRWLARGTFEHEFNGVPPNQREICWQSATIYRVRGGRIAEIWDFRDQLAILQQLQMPRAT